MVWDKNVDRKYVYPTYKIGVFGQFVNIFQSQLCLVAHEHGKPIKKSQRQTFVICIKIYLQETYYIYIYMCVCVCVCVCVCAKSGDCKGVLAGLSVSAWKNIRAETLDLNLKFLKLAYAWILINIFIWIQYFHMEIIEARILLACHQVFIKVLQ